MAVIMEKEKLKREIGVLTLSLAIINMTIGTGIFIIPAIISENLGAAAIVAYIVCGVLMFLIALCFAEVGSKVTSNGGTYTYIETAFGPFPGFIANNLFWFGTAIYLTKKGYAVLRVDDRGAGKSTGDFSNSTTADFAQDVEEHIRYAKNLPMIDTTQIGLLGHSEGGLIAPMVAVRNKSVSFVILLAGPGVEIGELMAMQNEMVLKSAGISQDAINAYIPLYKNLMKTIVSINSIQDANAKAIEIVKNWYSNTDKNLVKATTNISSESDINKFATTMSETLSTKWWKYFASYNPQIALQKLKCPVLAINGSSDIQVPADANLKAIELGLRKAGNKKGTTMKFDNLNHLFQKCTKCTVQEYGELENTIEPEVLEYIYNWLSKK